jgi:hypothetical protein
MHLRLGRAGSISSSNSFTSFGNTPPILYCRSSIICIVPMCVHSLRQNGSFSIFGRVLLHTVMICDTGSTLSSSIRIEETFVQLNSSDCHYSRQDHICNFFTKHDSKREATEFDGSDTSWAKLVDGEAPCPVVIELALAFRY